MILILYFLIDEHSSTLDSGNSRMLLKFNIHFSRESLSCNLFRNFPSRDISNH